MEEIIRSWLSLVHHKGVSRPQKLKRIEIHNNNLAALSSVKLSAKAEQRIEADLTWLQSDQHHFIPINDPRYPTLLKHIDDPPLALYAIGDPELMSLPQIAIVGSRRPTPVGARCAQNIAGDLANFGIGISSGLALGIDGLAHASALDAKGKSIAVLAHGLDQIYPQRNRELHGRLAAHGLIVSEYPLGTPPGRHRFGERNRIVSGLALGTVIIEAAERSGTLITARLTSEQNRELMVVPGSALSAQYRGSHQLLQQGASLVCNAQDVLACLNNEFASYFKDQAATRFQSDDRADPDHGLSSEQQHLLRLIGAESTPVDDIIQSSGLPADQVAQDLLMLEISGHIAAAADGGFVNIS